MNTIPSAIDWDSFDLGMGLGQESSLVQDSLLPLQFPTDFTDYCPELDCFPELSGSPMHTSDSQSSLDVDSLPSCPSSPVAMDLNTNGAVHFNLDDQLFAAPLDFLSDGLLLPVGGGSPTPELARSRGVKDHPLDLSQAPSLPTEDELSALLTLKDHRGLTALPASLTAKRKRGRPRKGTPRVHREPRKYDRVTMAIKIQRFHEKRARRKWVRGVEYQCRSQLARKRPRKGGRFVPKLMDSLGALVANTDSQ